MLSVVYFKDTIIFSEAKLREKLQSSWRRYRQLVIFALHKMHTSWLSLRHLSPIWSTERIIAETTKNVTADVIELSADARIITNVLMNGIESVVILTLPMRLREWVIAEARGSHSEFSYKGMRYSLRAILTSHDDCAR